MEKFLQTCPLTRGFVRVEKILNFRPRIACGRARSGVGLSHRNKRTRDRASGRSQGLGSLIWKDSPSLGQEIVSLFLHSHSELGPGRCAR